MKTNMQDRDMLSFLKLYKFKTFFIPVFLDVLSEVPKSNSVSLYLFKNFISCCRSFSQIHLREITSVRNKEG